MATKFLDTGEAFMSADDKRFARAVEVHSHIDRGAGFTLSPLVTTIVLGLAVAGLAIVAMAI